MRQMPAIITNSTLEFATPIRSDSNESRNYNPSLSKLASLAIEIDGHGCVLVETLLHSPSFICYMNWVQNEMHLVSSCKYRFFGNICHGFEAVYSTIFPTESDSRQLVELANSLVILSHEVSFSKV